MKTVLSIAGSDSSGGAGIQADLKTMIMNGVYGMTAITALTSQNTTGVKCVNIPEKSFLESQIDAVFEDIRPDAIKTGMIPTPELIETVAERLNFYKAKKIVCDPVMIATSGSRLMEEKAVEVLKNSLLPISEIVTPNISEAEVLSGIMIKNADDMEKAAKKIYDECGCNVLIKGGHSLNNADDLLYVKGNTEWIEGKRINNPNTHGTGCTLSSAIASNLAKNYDLKTSVIRAKKYITQAISANLNLGKGSGPLNHGYVDYEEFKK